METHNFQNHRIVIGFWRVTILALALWAIMSSTASVRAQEAPLLPSDLSLKIGISYEEAGQTVKAAEYYLKALEADPANAEALAALEALIAPPQPPPPGVPYLDLGRLYEGSAQPAKAAEYYLKALEGDPSNSEAMAALQAILKQQQAKDPRLAIADQYLAASQHDKAIEQYLEILADRPAQSDIQEKIISAIDDSDSISSLMQPEVEKVGKGIMLGLVTFLSLLLLWGIARTIRWFRQRNLDNEQRRYAILQFSNATGVQSLSGLHEAVRATITDWLYANHAAVHDSVLIATPSALPDVGLIAKLANWFSSQITPTPKMDFVDGVLLGARTTSGQLETGLTVRVRSKNGGQIDRVRTLWNPTSSADNADSYIQLAYAAATWIFKPAEVMQCGPAGILHQSNVHMVQAQLQQDPARALAEMAAGIELAQLADAAEQQLATTAAASLAAGNTGSRSAIVNPSTLAAERATIYAQMLTE